MDNPKTCLHLPFVPHMKDQSKVIAASQFMRDGPADGAVRRFLFLDWGMAKSDEDAQALAQAYGPLLLPVVEAFGLEVVLTGAGRLSMPLALCASQYGVLAPHVVGVTPRLGRVVSRGQREAEILAFIDALGLDEARVAWVAVDASVYGYLTRRAHFFGIRRDRGLQAEDMDSLRRRVSRMVVQAKVAAVQPQRLRA